MEELGTAIESCPCGHVYHKACIRNWIIQKRVCPQCKGDALPLVSLTFNLFQFTNQPRGNNSIEMLGTLNAEITSINLNIETEIGEINILEPQLAECRAEERAFSEGAKFRLKSKQSLEDDFERVFRQLTHIETRRKQFTDEAEIMKDKLNRSSMEFTGDDIKSRRPTHSSDVPKISSFLIADSRKLKEIQKEIQDLNSRVVVHKNRIIDLNKSVKAFVANGRGDAIKNALKSSDNRTNGFVPIDSIGFKRRREEERSKEIENRKPTLFCENGVTRHENETGLRTLSELVAALSESEDIHDGPRRVEDPVPNSHVPRAGKLDSFLVTSGIIVLD